MSNRKGSTLLKFKSTDAPSEVKYSEIKCLATLQILVNNKLHGDVIFPALDLAPLLCEAAWNTSWRLFHCYDFHGSSAFTRRHRGEQERWGETQWQVHDGGAPSSGEMLPAAGPWSSTYPRREGRESWKTWKQLFSPPAAMLKTRVRLSENADKAFLIYRDETNWALSALTDNTGQTV